MSQLMKQVAREIDRTKLSRPFKKIMQPRQRAFLKAYAICGTVAGASRTIGMHEGVHRQWMEKPNYAAAFAEARAMFCDVLEGEAIRRATKGVMRKKFYRGEPVIDPETGKQYVEYEKSDVLLIFTMKKHIPEYRDNNTGDGPTVGGNGRVLSVSDAIRLVQAANGSLPVEGEGKVRFVESKVSGGDSDVVKVKELMVDVDDK